MIRKSILLLAILGITTLFMVACNGSSNATDNPENRDWGTLTGLVINGATSEPITGASVSIESIPFGPSEMVPGIITRTTVSGQDGTFSRQDVPIGNIKVKVKMTGFMTPPMQTWSLTSAGSGYLTFTMYPGTDPIGKFEGNDTSAWDPTDKKH